MADNPITRKEKYLAKLTGSYTGNVPDPITRVEKYLYDLCQKGISGLTPEEIENAVNKYLKENPVQPGATTEQAQQIEQNKTDIASLKTETASLKEDISTKITKFYASNQGKAHLADSDNGKIMDMMLYGKSEQKRYSGKNLLNATMGTTTKNGITCTANDDGTFTLNGTATASFFFIIINNDDLKKAFGTNEELRLTGAPKGASESGYYLQIWKNEPEVIYRDTGGGVTAKKPNASCNVAIVIVNGVVCNNVLFKPMLTADLTATYDDFEPYVGGQPSPSPDYPQEIKSVVKPRVKVCGKNLIGKLMPGVIAFNTGNYVSGGTKYASTDFIPVKPGEKYTISNATTGGERWYYNSDKKSVIGMPKRNITVTIPENIAYMRVSCNTENKDKFQIELGATATAYQPYTESTATLPYTLNAIPVSSGGNVTINGQQYIADYVDVERGKLVRMVGECIISDMNQITRITTNTFFVYGIDNPFVINDGNDDITRLQTNKYQGVAAMNKANNKYFYRCWMSTHDNNKPIAFHSNTDDLSTFKNEVYGTKILYQLATPREIALTPEEITAFKALATYYPTTNISINSEQLDGYTVFNYPISMVNGWNYVKQQIGDTREYIYDMDARAQDTDLQAAEAYVNSEYAVALTELEV